MRGCEEAIFALTVAAAGGHHVLLAVRRAPVRRCSARRLVSILPELADSEQREVATIREPPVSAASGTSRSALRITPSAPPGSSAAARRYGPARSPSRTTASSTSMTSWSPRSTLDALRAPLADHGVSIVRSERGYRFPARFQLLAAVSLCPCGYGQTGCCVCDAATLVRHRRRLAGPLLDHFAIFIDLPAAVDVAAAPPGRRRPSCVIAFALRANGDEPPSLWRAAASDLSADAQAPLDRAYQTGSLSPRGRAQVLHVAQTIADLAGEASITATAVHAALALRGNLVGGGSQACVLSLARAATHPRGVPPSCCNPAAEAQISFPRAAARPSQPPVTALASRRVPGSVPPGQRATRMAARAATRPRPLLLGGDNRTELMLGTAPDGARAAIRTHPRPHPAPTSVNTVSPSPSPRYRTIVADPPWPLAGDQRRPSRPSAAKGGRRGRDTFFPYEPMPLDAIEALPARTRKARRAPLPVGARAFEPRGPRCPRRAGVALRGGVRDRRDKITFGLGKFPRPQHEILLVCRRGSLPFQVNNVGSVQRCALHGSRAGAVASIPRSLMAATT